MKLLSHTPCEVASKQDMNSTSIVEVAIKVCLMLLQDIAPPANIEMHPDVTLRESTQPAKFEFFLPSFVILYSFQIFLFNFFKYATVLFFILFIF